MQEDDRILLLGLTDFAPGRRLQIRLKHADGTEDTFPVDHTYNEMQINWFRAGSALNFSKQCGI